MSPTSSPHVLRMAAQFNQEKVRRDETNKKNTEAQRLAEREAKLRPLDQWINNPEVWTHLGEVINTHNLNNEQNVPRRQWFYRDLLSRLGAVKVANAQEANELIDQRIKYIMERRRTRGGQQEFSREIPNIPPQIPRHINQIIEDPGFRLALRMTFPPLGPGEVQQQEAFIQEVLRSFRENPEEFVEWEQQSRETDEDENPEPATRYLIDTLINYVQVHQEDFIERANGAQASPTIIEIDGNEEQQFITDQLDQWRDEFPEVDIDAFHTQNHHRLQLAYMQLAHRDAILAQLRSELVRRQQIIQQIDLIPNVAAGAETTRPIDSLNDFEKISIQGQVHRDLQAIEDNPEFHDAYNATDDALIEEWREQLEDALAIKDTSAYDQLIETITQQLRNVQALPVTTEPQSDGPDNLIAMAAGLPSAADNEVADQTVQQILDAILAEFPDREITQEMRDAALGQLVEAATPAQIEDAKDRIREAIPRHAARRQVAVPITSQPASDTTEQLSDPTQLSPASASLPIDRPTAATETYYTTDEIAALKPEADRLLHERISPFADQILEILEKYPSVVHLMTEYTEGMSTQDYATHVATDYYNRQSFAPDSEEIKAKIIERLEEKLQQKAKALEANAIQELVPGEGLDSEILETLQQIRQDFPRFIKRYGDERLGKLNDKLRKAKDKAEFEEILRQERTELQALEDLEQWKEDAKRKLEEKYGTEILHSRNHFIESGNWYTALDQIYDEIQNIEEGKARIATLKDQLELTIRLNDARKEIMRGFRRQYPLAVAEQEPVGRIFGDLNNATSRDGLIAAKAAVESVLKARNEVLVWLKDYTNRITRIENKYPQASANPDRKPSSENLHQPIYTIEQGERLLEEYENAHKETQEAIDKEAEDQLRNWKEQELPELIAQLQSRYAAVWEEPALDESKVTLGDKIESILSNIKKFDTRQQIIDKAQTLLENSQTDLNRWLEEQKEKARRELIEQFPLSSASQQRTYGSSTQVLDDYINGVTTKAELHAALVRARKFLEADENKLGTVAGETPSTDESKVAATDTNEATTRQQEFEEWQIEELSKEFNRLQALYPQAANLNDVELGNDFYGWRVKVQSASSKEEAEKLLGEFEEYLKAKNDELNKAELPKESETIPPYELEHMQKLTSDVETDRDKPELKEALAGKIDRLSHEIEALIKRYKSRGYEIRFSPQALAKIFYEQAPEGFTKSNLLFNINRALHNNFAEQAGVERFFEPYDTVEGDGNVEMEEALPFTDTQLEYVVQNFEIILEAGLGDLLRKFRGSQNIDEKNNTWNDIRDAVEEYKAGTSEPNNTLLPEHSFQINTTDELLEDDIMSQWLNNHTELFDGNTELESLYNSWATAPNGKERWSIFKQIRSLFGKQETRKPAKRKKKPTTPPSSGAAL